MAKLSEILTNEYTLSEKKFTKPEIYDANGDLTKRWHIYYYYRNPLSGKMQIQPPI